MLFGCCICIGWINESRGYWRSFGVGYSFGCVRLFEPAFDLFFVVSFLVSCSGGDSI